MSVLKNDRHIYGLYGLAFHSEIPLPCQVLEQTQANVRICYGQIRSTWPTPHHLARGMSFYADPGQLLVQINGIGRYLIEQGSLITIDPEPGVSEELIRLFLLGPIIGGLLHQRGVVPLHGSAIEVSQGAVLLLGSSGSGKSTLAAGFLRQGYRIWADDLAVIEPIPTGYRLCPSLPRLKLWEDSCENLAYPTHELTPVRAEARKFIIPLKEFSHQGSLPLSRIYHLMPADQPDVDIIPMRGSDKLMTLVNNTYRYPLLKEMGSVAHHFQHCLRIAEQISIHRIIRPRKGCSLLELILLIENDLCGLADPADESGVFQ